MAAKHLNWHVSIWTPLRAPNGPEVAKLTAAAIRKVMANVECLETVPSGTGQQ